ncbi:DUF4136 domain-containing protein [Fulvivirgaceae bacterium PWU4]|uniref:DUF4136 domain-containing protein n=1 Tax=Chryseosolibacter histidini TaxID=2782349 RepID=A0AAP2GR05_9BACT|nr:DUF4136 domain-containing protein [Chryseosolibacter histidini]MBT1699520.1 DUF4136 domain-containing protein [Chryseosolibacter histidini]
MKKQFLIIFTTALLAGCYPDGPDYVEDIDVVYTVYDQAYDFKTQKTFAMPDKIAVSVEVTSEDTLIEYMNPIYATPILQAIQRNMENYGWSRVNVDQNPDIVLTPAGLSTTTYFYSYWYDWWYGGYWGWYGWYYPPYYTVSSYTTGTLLMVVADPNQANQSPINRSPALWIAAANGLLTYSYDLSRVSEGIDQAFTQSPYLNLK